MINKLDDIFPSKSQNKWLHKIIAHQLQTTIEHSSSLVSLLKVS